MSNFFMQTLKSIVSYAVPISTAQLVRILIPVVSTIMVAHLGVMSLAANSLVSSYYIVSMLFAFGCVFSITMQAGHHVGSNNPIDATKTVVSGIWLSLAISLVSLLLYAFGPQILLLFGQDPKIVALTHGYFLWLAFGTIPYLILLALQQFLIAIGKPRLLFRLSVLITVLALATNYICIFGVGSWSGMGLSGLGVGYTLSAIVTLIATALCLVNSHQMYPILKHIFHIDLVHIKTLFRLGTPIGLNMIVEFAAMAVLVIMIGWISHYGLAAYQVVWQLISLGAMIPFGIGQASTALISRALGAKDDRLLQAYPLCAILIGLLAMMVISACYAIFNHALVMLFLGHINANTLKVAHIAESMLTITAVYQLFDVVRIVVNGCLRGLHDVYVPLLISFIGYWLIGLPIAAVLGFVFHLGAVGMWLGLASSIVVCTLMMVFRLVYRLKLEKAKCVETKIIQP